MGWLSSNWWLSPNDWLSSSWWLSSSNQYTSIGDYLSLPLCQLSRTVWTAECAFALFHLPLKIPFEACLSRTEYKDNRLFFFDWETSLPFCRQFLFFSCFGRLQNGNSSLLRASSLRCWRWRLLGLRMAKLVYFGDTVRLAPVLLFTTPLVQGQKELGHLVKAEQLTWWMVFFLKRSLSTERALTEKASLIPWDATVVWESIFGLSFDSTLRRITGTTTNSLNALKFSWWQQSATAQDFKDRAVVEEDCLWYENVRWQCLTARIIRKMERGPWIIHNYPSIHNCQLLGCSRPGRGQGKGCLTNRATYWKLPGVQEDEAWAKASQDQAAA